MHTDMIEQQTYVLHNSVHVDDGYYT